MKITLTNKTHYLSADLRAIVRKACDLAGVSKTAQIICTVLPGKLHVRGRATVPRARSTLGCGKFRLSIPTYDQWEPGRHGERARTLLDHKIEVCQVALHEAMHLAGARHKDMTDEQRYCKMPVPWAEDLHLRAKGSPVPEQPEEHLAAARADRLEHAQAMLAKARTRTKRATTIEKKWKRRVATLGRP
jgi:hypothetical protein